MMMGSILVRYAVSPAGMNTQFGKMALGGIIALRVLAKLLSTIKAASIMSLQELEKTEGGV